MAEIRFKNSRERVAVNSIFCVGRNYADHAAELNNPVPKAPLIFLKPVSALTASDGTIELPSQSREVHFEVEVVALIGKSGRHISKDAALGYVRGYGIGIDVTARDIQQWAKEKSHPWTVAKGFDTFAPLSDFLPSGEIANPGALDFQLSINGKIRQKGNTRDMLFPLPDLIAYLSSIFTLTPGDLIFTGTPRGVGQLQEGDQLTAVLGERLTTLEVSVKKRATGF